MIGRENIRTGANTPFAMNVIAWIPMEKNIRCTSMMPTSTWSIMTTINQSCSKAAQSTCAAFYFSSFLHHHAGEVTANVL